MPLSLPGSLVSGISGSVDALLLPTLLRIYISPSPCVPAPHAPQIYPQYHTRTAHDYKDAVCETSAPVNTAITTRTVRPACKIAIGSAGLCICIPFDGGGIYTLQTAVTAAGNQKARIDLPPVGLVLGSSLLRPAQDPEPKSWKWVGPGAHEEGEVDAPWVGGSTETVSSPGRPSILLWVPVRAWAQMGRSDDISTSTAASTVPSARASPACKLSLAGFRFVADKRRSI
ncbi:uncharacterized protein N7482_010258 [Penicillium canariense]|uniref:Uncharacterized protein n=1 Tax=Penicillium canariense TaxID=189055 RepID=A0A9W9HM67_9EURO|nr:uncharacterized protein N7482_010258 [Penicillium canariense]KAJ5151006.1 hypothetical protein N7482_010258 [Penicillium canariense]